MSSNNVGQLITKTITVLEHFATLHPTTLLYIYIYTATTCFG